HPVDGLLGTPPELAGLVCAVRLARDVVPRGRASEREAAVAAARALADAARVVDAHTLALGRQRGRAGAARDAGADDRNIELGEFRRGAGGPRLGQPETLGLHVAMLRDAGAHPEVDASTGRYEPGLLDHRLRRRGDLLVTRRVRMVAVVREIVRFVVGVVGAL